MWVEAQPQPFPKFPSFISQTKKGKSLDLGRGRGEEKLTISSPILRGEEPGVPKPSPSSSRTLSSPLTKFPRNNSCQRIEVRQSQRAERRKPGLGSLKEGETGGFLSILDSQ